MWLALLGRECRTEQIFRTRHCKDTCRRVPEEGEFGAGCAELSQRDFFRTLVMLMHAAPPGWGWTWATVSPRFICHVTQRWYKPLPPPKENQSKFRGWAQGYFYWLTLSEPQFSLFKMSARSFTTYFIINWSGLVQYKTQDQRLNCVTLRWYCFLKFSPQTFAYGLVLHSSVYRVQANSTQRWLIVDVTWSEDTEMVRGVLLSTKELLIELRDSKNN